MDKQFKSEDYGLDGMRTNANKQLSLSDKSSIY
jgi:hypothetical protein